CDGPCSVSIDFAEGGTINATDGAVLTFGPENGLLALGAGGSINYGAGGGFVPLEGGLPDMSQGGTITLGPGGIINFGPGGSLATGIGGVTANGLLEVTSAVAVAIDSEHAVHLGDLDSDGRVELTTDGDVGGCDASALIRFTMRADDPETTLTITAAAGMSLGSFKGNPDVYVTAGDSGSVTLCIADGAFQGGDGDIFVGGDVTVTCTGCGSNVTLQELEVPDGDGDPAAGGTGSPGGLTLLALPRRRLGAGATRYNAPPPVEKNRGQN
ncbi:MAG: hypothetical protein ACT4PK_03670, partial [Gammaproteobacteria bacterium]